jgi:hypothetical protein
MKLLTMGGVAALALTAAIAGSANAQLVSTNGGDGYLGTPDPGYDFLVVGSNNGVGESLTSFTGVAPVPLTLDVIWSYTTYDCCGSFWDPGGYILNGVETQLTPSLAPYADVGATYTGSFTISLAPGDTFGAYIDSVDSVAGPGAIEFGISLGTPEPATWAMMLSGFGLVGLALRRRKPALAAL